MGILERRERERVEVRRKILDAARELFDTEGYDRVTMRRIGEAIEYSPTTIYNHFEDKDDLVKALCEEDFAQLLSAIGDRPAPRDPVEWVRQLGRAYVSFGLQNPNHYRFMFMTAAKFSHRVEPASPGTQSFGLLRRAVELGQEQGVFREGDVDTLAQVMWANVHGVVALLITLQEDHWPTPASPDLAEQVIENGIRGLLKEADAR